LLSLDKGQRVTKSPKNGRGRKKAKKEVLPYGGKNMHRNGRGGHNIRSKGRKKKAKQGGSNHNKTDQGKKRSVKTLVRKGRPTPRTLKKPLKGRTESFMGQSGKGPRVQPPSVLLDNRKEAKMGRQKKGKD